jgi:hypothetical protein
MVPLVFLIKEINRSTEIVVTIDSSIVVVTYEYNLVASCIVETEQLAGVATSRESTCR